MIWAAIAAISFLAGAFQTVTGFGAAVVLMTVLPHFFNMLHAAALSSAINVGLGVALIWRYRKKVDLCLCALPAVLYVGAGLAMIHIVGQLDLCALTIGFGAFLVALSVYFLVFSARARVTPRPGVVAACSLFSGCCSGLFSIGGPPMALCFLALTDDHEVYSANLQFIFLAANALGVIARVRNGIFTVELLPYTLAGVAAVLLGIAAGRRILGRLDPAVLRRAIYIFVGLSGVLTLVQNL